jgi:hypothetical protein
MERHVPRHKHTEPETVFLLSFGFKGIPMLRLTLAVAVVAACGTVPASAQTLVGVQDPSAQTRTIQTIGDGSNSVPIAKSSSAIRIAPSPATTGTMAVRPVVGPVFNQDEAATPEVSSAMMPSAEPVGSNLKFGGWIQTGFHSNNTALFNNRPDQVNLQQLWFYAQREAAREYYWDWGFRVDLMYGTDASKTQSFGNPAGTWDFQNGLDFGGYGWAIPQAYAELANEKWSVKLGHFYTLVGYEVVTAPDNFFYSHAYTMFNSEPFTHTGALASYEASDSLTLHSGWTLGWDTGFNQLNGGSSFLGGFSKSLSDELTFTYISTAGNFGLRGNGYSHSMVFDNQLTEKLNYVFQSDLVSTDSTGNNNNEVGINQYLLYTISDRLKAGTRVEWWKSDIGGSTQSTYAVTGGFNITPSEKLIVRPEVRYNWGADLVGADMETPIFGIDAIIVF